MRRRADAILTNPDTTRFCDGLCYLGSWQDATVARLCTLAKLYLDHPDLILGSSHREHVWVEATS